MIAISYQFSAIGYHGVRSTVSTPGGHGRKGLRPPSTETLRCRLAECSFQSWTLGEPGEVITSITSQTLVGHGPDEVLPRFRKSARRHVFSSRTCCCINCGSRAAIKNCASTCMSPRTLVFRSSQHTWETIDQYAPPLNLTPAATTTSPCT